MAAIERETSQRYRYHPKALIKLLLAFIAIFIKPMNGLKTFLSVFLTIYGNLAFNRLLPTSCLARFKARC